MEFTYTVTLARNEISRKPLPNLKQDSFFPVLLRVNSDHKEIEVKLVADKPLLSLNESVFYDRNEFSLLDYKSQITSANGLSIQVKNLIDDKSITAITVSITVTYIKVEGLLVYSNTYSITTAEYLDNILTELQNIEKHITTIIWTAPAGLQGITFEPIFKSSPVGFYETFSFSAENGKIIHNIEGHSFIQNLKYYKMILHECKDTCVKKLGISVYGF